MTPACPLAFLCSYNPRMSLCVDKSCVLKWIGSWQGPACKVSMCARAKYTIRQCHSFPDILLLVFVPGVCSSVLRKNWRCTVPAAALGSRLLHPGMILVVIEDAKSREGLGRWKDYDLMWFLNLCENLSSFLKNENENYTVSRSLHLWLVCGHYWLLELLSGEIPAQGGHEGLAACACESPSPTVLA